VGDAVVDPRLALALRLAEDAGRHAVARAGRAAVEWKGPGDRVTDVDRRVQARMVREIATWFPNDGLVAEEDEYRTGLDREFVWVVDPLDGTNNYALGIPTYAVAIGVLRAGTPYAGIVHDPNTGFTCTAVCGRGAFAGDRRLTLAARPLSASSNVSVRVPLDVRLEPVAIEWLRHYKLRAFGSVALTLAYAALGAIDIVLDHRAALWDIVAGAAILLEAGGRLTDPAGERLFPGTFEGVPIRFLAGNPAAHAEAVAACAALERGGAA
jgi:myo-inositol-1(or 4)-monophosphatase